MSIQKTIRVPNELHEAVYENKKTLKESRGREPTFAAWVIEAMAEKLARETKGKQHK